MTEQSLRETLESTVAKVEASEASPATPTPQEPSPPATPQTPAPEQAPQKSGDEQPTKGDEQPTKGDEQPTKGDEPAKGPEGAASKEQKPSQGGAPTKSTRPPESWKPEVRGLWAKLPAPVQAEIQRRERQVETALQQSAEARRGMNDINNFVNSFRDVFEFEKAAPIQTLHNIMGAARALRFGQPTQKAQVMAQLVQGYAIDLKLLDQALAFLYANSQGPDPAQVAIQSAVAQQLQPVNQFVAQQQHYDRLAEQAHAQQTERALEAEIQEFASKPESAHFDEVRDVMADLLEAAANRGQKMTLAEAHQRAILTVPEFANEVLAAKAAAASKAAEEAAAKSAFSLTGSPGHSTSAGQSNGTLRGDVERAVAQASGRRL